ncbi:unnamed protein product [Adineta steineri]|uniref:4Fe-4S ferredoxin-type domain-containing protein n=1 Tax=Adineta steineri TaxID=433720 RepID=A0A814DMR0_9BILA|nr:unnamed protein product [Adineta steineri]CAF3714194.1 unnamed protein product [Adineta steineri]
MAIIIGTFITPALSDDWACDCVGACFSYNCYVGAGSYCNNAACGAGCGCCLNNCPKDMFNSIWNLKRQLSQAQQDTTNANGKYTTCSSSLATANQNYQNATQLYQTADSQLATCGTARDTCCNRATKLAGGRDNAISALNAIANVRRRLFNNDNQRRFFQDDEDDRRE